MSTETTRNKLTDLGEALGTDPMAYIRACGLFDNFEEIAKADVPQSKAAQSLIDALNLIHMAVCGKTAVNSEE